MASTTLTAEVAALNDHELYQNPTRFCDIIMKGGITSGVVYPLAICELAREYRFKSIGGASAGAIAAGGAAAAEYGRDNPEGGFKLVSELPEWVGSDHNLFNLFQPERSTRGIFRVVLKLVDGNPLTVLWAAIRSFPFSTILGLLPGVALAIAALSVSGWPRYVGLAGALLLGVVLLLLALAYGFVRTLLREVPRNHFGVCSGYAPYVQGQPEALSVWMTRYYNQLSGRDPDGDPLTFADLWGTSDESAPRNIDLALMTTSLTQGRAYRLPLSESGFYFNEAEFRRLFPGNVVDWMVATQRPSTRPQDGLVPLPKAADMPIVVAARMSLSFPILLSAIPLYRIDYSLPVVQGQERRAEVVWFSDGGITSNFPVHFFDSPLPRWPTFGINLRGFQHGRNRSERESDNVFFPATNRQGLLEWWSRFDEEPDPAANALRRLRMFLFPSLKPIGGFLGSIKNTMQNAGDNALTRQAGYRDRILHVSLDGDEGGLNLEMDDKKLERLSERGRWAGVKLRTEFDWENHRWIRYRSSMACMTRLLAALRRGYQTNPQLGGRSYQELVNRKIGTPPVGYPWRSIVDQKCAFERTESMVNLAEEWNEAAQVFDGDAPSPPLDFRMTPRL